jgi:P-type Cu+ transporter
MLIKERTLKINGMTCASCVSAVERSVNKLEGVKNARINLATEKLTVAYDESDLSLDQIKNAIKDAGYSTEDHGTVSEIIMTISGMT